MKKSSPFIIIAVSLLAVALVVILLTLAVMIVALASVIVTAVAAVRGVASHDFLELVRKQQKRFEHVKTRKVYTGGCVASKFHQRQQEVRVY